tara:strand:- start:110 stop:451 length:342 start_codon:yes stop_codon:yes gene_type:complete
MKTKISSLKKKEDFKSILGGKKIANRYSTIFFKKLENQKPEKANISFVTKKKIGNSVERNKIKRRLRNLMNELAKNSQINLKYSYLLIAKRSLLNDKFNDIKQSLFSNLKKIK